MTDTLNIGGEGGNSFPFDVVGAQVQGQIVDMSEVQQTNLQTGEPKFFESGQPMMMYRLVLQTQLRDAADPQDDGKRSIYLKGSRKPESQSSLAAVLTAVKQTTGGSDLRVGGTLALQYVGDGQAANRGFNAPKLYAASYQAPTINLAGQQQTAPQVQQQQPNAWDNPTPPAQQQPAPQEAVAAPAQQQMAPPIQQAPQPQLAPAAAPAGNQQEIAAALANLGITPEQLAALAAQQAAPQPA